MPVYTKSFKWQLIFFGISSNNNYLNKKYNNKLKLIFLLFFYELDNPLSYIQENIQVCLKNINSLKIYLNFIDYVNGSF